ncbi:MAG: hypothetical protein WBG80_07445, partial [Bacteroidota bacterium]
MSTGPDTRRLSRDGDFTIDLRYAELLQGSNTVQIVATSDQDELSQTTVQVQNQSGAIWPMPYALSWGSSTSLQDSAQVVDGKWSVVSGGARVMEPGYDRMIAIGDTSWGDYEITVEVTVQSIDSTAEAFDPISAGPGVGIIMRWEGHTDTPSFTPPIVQPRSGYLPLGALGWYHWRTGFGSADPNRWELLGDGLALRNESSAPQLQYGIPYIFKMQVKTVTGTGGLYKFKVWEASGSEPAGWLMTDQESLSSPQRGSFLLVAHHANVTFGSLTVTPVPDDVPPVITNIQSSASSTTASITWTTDEPATSRVSYGLTSSYGDIVIDDQLVFNHSVELQGLAPDRVYHYMVISTDFGGNASNSSDTTFRTGQLPPPPAPIALLPGDGSSGLPGLVVFRWSSVVGAETYRLQVGTDSSFVTGLAFDDSTLVDTTAIAGGLQEGARYYWRIGARNAGGSGPYASTWSFETGLSVPLLVSPLDGAPEQPSALTLRWNTLDAATSYHVQVATDSGFTTGFALDDPNVVDTVRDVTGLLNGAVYYWRVRGRNGLSSGPFSSAWSFSTGLSAPTLVTPSNGSFTDPDDTVLRWDSVSHASTYQVQVATDPSFSSGVVLDDPSVSDTMKVVTGLASGTIFYWRVSARNGGGPGPVSEVWSFTTTLPAPVLASPGNNATGQPL